MVPVDVVTLLGCSAWGRMAFSADRGEKQNVLLLSVAAVKSPKRACRLGCQEPFGPGFSVFPFLLACRFYLDCLFFFFLNNVYKAC